MAPSIGWLDSTFLQYQIGLPAAVLHLILAIVNIAVFAGSNSGVLRIRERRNWIELCSYFFKRRIMILFFELYSQFVCMWKF